MHHRLRLANGAGQTRYNFAIPFLLLLDWCSYECIRLFIESFSCLLGLLLLESGSKVPFAVRLEDKEKKYVILWQQASYDWLLQLLLLLKLVQTPDSNSKPLIIGFEMRKRSRDQVPKTIEKTQKLRNTVGQRQKLEKHFFAPGRGRILPIVKILV